MMFSCLLVGTLGGLAFHTLDLYERVPPKPEGVLDFDIARGESLHSVLDRMSEIDVLPSPWLVRAMIRWKGLGGCHKAGTHQLELPMSPEEILVRLCDAPRAPAHRFTITEGMTLWEIDRKLRKTGLAQDASLLTMDSGEFREDGWELPSTPFISPGPYPNRLEGYLFPDTYQLPMEEPVVALLRKSLGKMKSELARIPGETTTADVLPDWHKRLTLASIVQREAVVTEEMPHIASVYVNRLRKEMPLQADPTMNYGPKIWMQKPGPKLRKDATNPYNTYAHSGLPPGPIGAVGRDAILAVMRPAITSDFYFVAHGDGSGRHAFSPTYEEHKKNVARYRKARKKR